MKYKPDKKLNATGSVGVAERQSLPILTLILIFMILFVSYLYQSAHTDIWITRNTFQFSQILELINTNNYSKIFGLLFTTNFANPNIWFMLPSIYFLSVFAIPVEKRLGPPRFLLLIFLACTIPWLVQFIDLSRCADWPLPFEHSKHDLYFFGPYCIVLALAGAYRILVPDKKLDPTHSRLYIKDRTEIFNKKPKKEASEFFGFAPKWFFLAGLLYVLAAHYLTALFFPDYDTIGLYAGLTALFTGFLTGNLIHLGLRDTYEEHPLKLAAIKHYYELLDLDVGHENAVRGAAKGLGLPDYQVENWVKKSKGKLRPT